MRDKLELMKYLLPLQLESLVTADFSTHCYKPYTRATSTPVQTHRLVHIQTSDLYIQPYSA